jgi:putative transposase
MSRNSRFNDKDAQLRRTAVKLYRSGTPATEVARQLRRSRCWVYKWVRYRADHPWTRFRSASRAPHHHPNQLSAKNERRIAHLRQLLMRHRQPRLRFALVGARTIQQEWRRRYPEPPPSLRTIQRVLKRHHLTVQSPKRRRHAYRPHPLATFPDAVHATDIITRWITGGAVVQTFNTVDIYSNDVYSTSHATKTAVAACQHLLQTWQQLGIPDVAQFDNESAFSGGNHPWVLGKVVRLCLYMGIEVLFIPLREPDYNSPVETFNHLWAQQFWGRHHFTRRRDVSRVWRTFLAWYRSQYIAPRQPDTPERMRLGAQVYTLAAREAENLPSRLPICAGRVHAVRRVSPEGQVRFLNQSLRVGKRYRERYVWLTLETAHQRLSIWCQARAGAPWKRLKTVAAPMSEPVVKTPKRFARLHAARQPKPRHQAVTDNGSKPAKIAAQPGS